MERLSSLNSELDRSLEGNRESLAYLEGQNHTLKNAVMALEQQQRSSNTEMQALLERAHKYQSVSGQTQLMLQVVC